MAGDRETSNPLSGATPDELRYLAGALAILRSNDPVFAEGIRRAVDSWEHINRKAKADSADRRRTG